MAIHRHLWTVECQSSSCDATEARARSGRCAGGAVVGRGGVRGRSAGDAVLGRGRARGRRTPLPPAARPRVRRPDGRDVDRPVRADGRKAPAGVRDLHDLGHADAVAGRPGSRVSREAGAPPVDGSRVCRAGRDQPTGNRARPQRQVPRRAGTQPGPLRADRVLADHGGAQRPLERLLGVQRRRLISRRRELSSLLRRSVEADSADPAGRSLQARGSAPPRAWPAGAAGRPAASRRARTSQSGLPVGATGRGQSGDRRQRARRLLARKRVRRLGRHRLLRRVSELRPARPVLRAIRRQAVRPVGVGLYGWDDPAFVHDVFAWVRAHARVRMLNYYQGFSPSDPENLAHYPGSRRALRHELRPRRYSAYPPEYAHPHRRRHHRPPPERPPQPPSPGIPPTPPTPPVPPVPCAPLVGICLPGA
jgi:hypothetical protein